MRATDWTAPVWQMPNVHVASDGSFVGDTHIEPEQP